MHKESILDSNDYIGLRLDKFLRDKFYLTNSLVCQFIQKGKILVNSTKSRISYRIASSDIITSKIDLNKFKNDDLKSKKETYIPNIPEKIIQLVKNSIIYEDDNVLCIDKPYGIASQGGTKIKYSITDFFPHLSTNQLFIVHRLDIQTTGVLVLAKNIETARIIGDHFKNHNIIKKYHALVSPIPKLEKGIIDTDIIVEDTPKSAITEYKILKINPEKNIALLELTPKTGRKHQIRIHLKHIGSPIIGDEKHGGNMQLAKELQLHAHSLKIPGFDVFVKNISLKFI